MKKIFILSLISLSLFTAYTKENSANTKANTTKKLSTNIRAQEKEDDKKKDIESEIKLILDYTNQDDDLSELISIYNNITIKKVLERLPLNKYGKFTYETDDEINGKIVLKINHIFDSENDLNAVQATKLLEYNGMLLCGFIDDLDRVEYQADNKLYYNYTRNAYNQKLEKLKNNKTSKNI